MNTLSSMVRRLENLRKKENERVRRSPLSMFTK